MATDGLEFSDIYLLVRGALVSGNGRSSISRVARRKNDQYMASNLKAKYTHEIFFYKYPYHLHDVIRDVFLTPFKGFLIVVLG